MPKYDVFVSHAGEDKAPLAVLIYEGLKRRGISAFLDERELLVGRDAVQEMDEAMQTAILGLFILSPEFALKVYPMLEAECFLRRAGLLGDGEEERGMDCPELVPVFYRLTVAGCKYAEVFEKAECDEVLRERFNERVRRGETRMKTVLQQLTLLARLTGIENKTGITNDDTEEMKMRREYLAEKICNEVTGVLVRRGRKIEADSERSRRVKEQSEDERRRRVEEQSEDERSRRMEEQSEEELRATFDVPKNPREVVLDFSSATEGGKPQTYEAEVLREVLRNNGGCKVISVFGEGGVGKSCILREVARHKAVWEQFPGGVYFISLGMDGSVESLRTELLRILRISGRKQKAEQLRDEKSIEPILGEVGKLVGKGRSLLMLDDVWERNGIKGEIVSDVSSVLSSEHGGMVVLTTRSADVASRGDVTIDVKPREAVSEVTKNIILEYAKCTAEEVEKERVWWVVEKLQRMSVGLPVCLAVVGRGVGKLRVLVKSKAWMMYWKKIRGRAESLLQGTVNNYKSLQTTLSIALQVLEENEETETKGLVYSWTEMYGSLCIMKKQRIIPACVLERMWKLRRAGDVLTVIEGFSGVGLGEIVCQGDDMKGVRVHDLLHDFAMSLVWSEEEIIEWHRRLLDGYICARDESVRDWWSLQDDGYIHENVSRHLQESRAIGELTGLLLMAKWTNSRLKLGGLLAWKEDFMHCLKGMERGDGNDNREETRSGLCLVRDAVSACWPAVRVNDRLQLGFQMYGRLQEAKEWPVQEYLGSVRAWQSGLWLKPDRECWPRPGQGLSEEIALGDDIPFAVSLLEKPLCAVVGTARGCLIVVNAEEKRVVKRWDGHKDPVTRVAITNDGNHILSYSIDGAVKRWDANTGAEVGVIASNDLGSTDFDFDFPRDLGLVTFSPELRTLVMGSKDGGVRIFDVETSEEVGDAMRGVECAVRCVDISQDGSRVVAGGECGSVHLWNAATRVQLWEVPDGHNEEVLCISFSPDRRFVASASKDGTIRLWNASTGAQIGNSFEGHRSGVWCLAFSYDSRRIVSGGEDMTVRVWNLENGEQVGRPLRGHDSSVTFVAVGGDGRFVISGSVRSIRIWDLVDMDVSRDDCFTPDSLVSCVVASWDRQFYVSAHFVYSPTIGSELRIWDSESRKQVGDPMHVTESFVMCVAICPDCRHFVCGMADGTLRVWDVITRSPVGKELRAHTRVRALAYSPSGRWIVSGSDDKTARVWSVVADLKVDDSAGPVLMTWIKRWWAMMGTNATNNIDNGSKRIYEHDHEVSCVAFSADERRVICGLENGNLCVWETSTGKIVGSADSEHSCRVVRIDILKPDHFRSLDRGGKGMWWRVESGGGLKRISAEHNDDQPGGSERQSYKVLAGDDEVVCDTRYVRLGAGGPIVGTLPTQVMENSWHYDSSRGVVVTGLMDGQLLFSQFVR